MKYCNFSAEYIDKINLRLRREAKNHEKPANNYEGYKLENEDSDKPKTVSDSIYANGLQNDVKQLNYDIK